jgi:hypothetical protein
MNDKDGCLYNLVEKNEEINGLKLPPPLLPVERGAKAATKRG